MKQPANFTVDTISAGQGEVMVFVEDPEGNREEVCISRNLVCHLLTTCYLCMHGMFALG